VAEELSLALPGPVQQGLVMQGLMQDTQLTTNWIFERGGRYFGTKTVVTNTRNGLETCTFADVRDEARKIAAALDTFGVSADGRVATFA